MKKSLCFLVILFLALHLRAQNVGIGTALPQMKLHIKGGLLLDSTNGSTPVSGAGTRMMWIPEKASFRAGIVSGTEWDDANIGNFSFAGGNSTTASGDYSTAIGNISKASGWASTALGQSTIASGYVSTAMGNMTQATGGTSTAMGASTTASGTASTAMGYYTKSKSCAGFVAGLYNDSTNAANASNPNALNRIFQIGNGTADNARSNAMTVLQNGNVGINITTPQSTLQVNNGAILFDGTTGVTPVSGAGTRMMWIPEKASFRAGIVSGTEWDDANIGNFSFAGGNSTTASGDYSTAIGNISKASGWASTALGQSAIASGYVSTAMGHLTRATGGTSTAMGASTTASGDASTAMGLYTKSKSLAGFVAGLYNDSTNAANASFPNALNRIFQIGNGTADNARSNAMTVLQNGNVGIGELDPAVPLNFASSLGSKISLWGNAANHYGMGIQANLMQFYVPSNGDNIAFGYGSSTAFTETVRLLGNGNVGIGTTAPTAKLSVNGTANNSSGAWGLFSDERIKTISGNFTDGLNVIKQIKPVLFKYNDKAPFQTPDEQIGIVAQELEKIAPYMVSKKQYNQFTDLREVNNQAYVFLLINAVKEQQVLIEEDKAKISSLEEKVLSLESRLKTIEEKLKL